MPSTINTNETLQNEITCPCQEFKSLKTIRKALDSRAETKVLLDWFTADKESVSTLCEQSPNSQRCVQRMNSSLELLNAIREACWNHVESGNVSHSNDLNSQKTNDDPQQSYEEAFPSLRPSAEVSANILVAKKKKQSSPSGSTPSQPIPTKSKAKRRIRPAPAIVENSGPSVSSWSMPQTISTPGNISSLPSESPISIRNIHGKGQSHSGISSRLGTRHLSRALTAKDTDVWNRQIKSKASHEKGSSKNMQSKVNNETKAQVQPTPVTDRRSAELQLGHLAAVYATIITNHLVPSTALELHFLISLMVVPKNSSAVRIDEGMNCFQSLFLTGDDCRTFSAFTLRRLKRILCSLGYDLVNALSECPPIQELLPEVAIELIAIAEKLRQSRLSSGIQTVSIGTSSHVQTPMLTLPFKEDRDSRHHYRGREASNLYKNREEARDAFLYQLRGFQSRRGRVLDASDDERFLQRLQVASRDVVQGVLPANMFWFAQFFCDLMLQIGLLPMEETDKEILSITEKEKLQKLHRRFSSKAGKTNKTAQKLMFDQNNNFGSMMSSLQEPQQFFPGHQEFFFIFLQSANSFSFGEHLKRRLVGTIKEIAAIKDVNGHEHRIFTLMMVSRFLGVLEFSPNWTRCTDHNQVDVLPKSSLNDEIALLDLRPPVLLLDSIIETAWSDGSLVTVIPWVVEFLRMLTWDGISKSTTYYKGVFALIRSIQVEHLHDNSLDLHISFFCETLFYGVVGLGRTASLSHALSCTRQKGSQRMSNESLSKGDLSSFSKAFTFASNAHLEELFTLVCNLKDQKENAAVVSSNITPRKMRPYVLSVEKGSSAGHQAGVMHPLKSLDSLGGEDGGTVSIQRKLSDAFFHQHQELKEICDFIIPRLLKTAALTMPVRCIRPSLEAQFRNYPDVPSTSSDVIGNAKHVTLAASRKFLSVYLARSIRQMLQMLATPSQNDRVLDVATKLALSHSMNVGERMILDAVEGELNTHRRQIQLQTTEDSATADSIDSGKIDTAIESINHLANVLISHRQEKAPDSALVAASQAAKTSMLPLLTVSTEKPLSFRFQKKSSLGTRLDHCGPSLVALLEYSFSQEYEIGIVPAPSTLELLEITVLLKKTGFCRRLTSQVAALLKSEKFEDITSKTFSNELKKQEVETLSCAIAEMTKTVS